MERQSAALTDSPPPSLAPRGVVTGHTGDNGSKGFTADGFGGSGSLQKDACSSFGCDGVFKSLSRGVTCVLLLPVCCPRPKADYLS